MKSKIKNTLKKKKAFGNFNIDELWQKYEGQFSESCEKFEDVNLLIMENIEADRKNLLNNIIRDDNLTAIIKESLMHHTKKITRYKYPMTIFDVPAYRGESSAIKNEILSVLNQNDIHCIWYCLDVSTGDVNFQEIKWMKEMFNDSIKDIPVICILTQAKTKKDIKNVTKKLEKENIRFKEILPVFIKELNDLSVQKGLFKKAPNYGLKNVTEKTLEVLPAENQKAFLNIQNFMDLKKKAGEKRIRECVQESVKRIFMPDPTPDSILLFPLQIDMLTDLAYIMGTDVSEDFVKGFIFCTIGIGAAGKAGKGIFVAIRKILPGGYTIEKLTRIATALVVTYTLGEVFMHILARIYKGERTVEYYSTPEGMDEIRKSYKKRKKANDNIDFTKKLKDSHLLLEMKEK